MATTPVNSAAFYADFGKLDALRHTAQRDPQAAVKSAAKQFEGIFTQMMLKTMRSASLGEGLGDSEETKFYQDMFDQQLSMQLSNGKGIGLADRLLVQLQRSGLAPGGAPSPASPGVGASGARSAPALPMPGAAAIPAPLQLHIVNGPSLPHAPLRLAPLTSDNGAPAEGTEADPGATLGAAIVSDASSNTSTPDDATVANASGDAATLPAAALSRREAFIASIQPAAERVAQQLGVATSTIIAHAALESGWGQHLPAAASNNLFGVKAGASWQGASVQAATTEVSAGQPQRMRASFRAYDSMAAGLQDYARVLGSSPRYAQALNQGSDVAAFARGLQAGGYATDPAYADKLVATAAAVRQFGAAQPLKNAPVLPTTGAGGTG
jgi:flagellar protein FlgJ